MQTEGGAPPPLDSGHSNLLKESANPRKTLQENSLKVINVLHYFSWKRYYSKGVGSCPHPPNNPV